MAPPFNHTQMNSFHKHLNLKQEIDGNSFPCLLQLALLCSVNYPSVALYILISTFNQIGWMKELLFSLNVMHVLFNIL